MPVSHWGPTGFSTGSVSPLQQWIGRTIMAKKAKAKKKSMKKKATPARKKKKTMKAVAKKKAPKKKAAKKAVKKAAPKRKAPAKKPAPVVHHEPEPAPVHHTPSWPSHDTGSGMGGGETH
jgi:hypothetical protein